MKKQKTGIILGTVALMLSTAVSANATELNVKPDFSSDILVVSGKAQASEQITVMVFEDGITPGNFWDKIPGENIKNTIASGAGKTFETVAANADGTVSFVDDFYADAEGGFSHTLGLKESGVYDVYLLYSGSGELKVIEDVSFTASGDYKEKIEELNDAEKDAFITELSKPETKELLGFEDEINDSVDAEDVAEILYESIKNDGLSDDFDENLGLYRASAAIALLNDGKDVDASYFEYVLSEDESLEEYFEKYADEDIEFITDYLKNEDIKNTDELTEKMKEAILLVVVKNPNGYENIKEAFADFKDITGISSPTSKSKVYSKLAGEEFDSRDELVKAYEDALENASEGGGSGSGSGSGSNKNNSYSVQPSTTVTQAVGTINKNIFDDLDSVPWAQEAIVTLAAKGVINGKSEKLFAPNDSITREEFTKLVVAALAYDATPANITFSDVESSRWSYPYIAKAKGAGLINGYSDNFFGATDLITRQDMSVIIYNAAKYKEIKIEDGNDASAFADDAYIADYAKEAVYTLKVMEIVNGTDAAHFAPQAFATRAQAAVMLYRLLLK